MKKSSGTRFLELFDSLKIIGDSLELIKKGKDHQIIPLSGQIRAILFDNKTSKGKNKIPLILEVAQSINYDTDIYILEKKGDFVKEGLVFNYEKPIVSLKKENQDYKKISLKDYIKTKICKIDNQDKTIEQVVKAFANKNGGAHYDSTTPEFFYNLCLIKIDNRPLIYYIIEDLGKILYEICLEILRQQTEFEFQILFGVNENKTKGIKNIISYRYKNNSMGLSLKLNGQNKIQVILSGIKNETLFLVSDLNLDECIFLSIHYEITNSLTTKLVVSLNEGILHEKEESEPIFIYNQFDTSLIEFGDDNFELFVSQIMVYSRYLLLEEKQQNLKFINSLLRNKTIKGKYFNSKVLPDRTMDGVKLSKPIESIEFNKFKKKDKSE